MNEEPLEPAPDKRMLGRAFRARLAVAIHRSGLTKSAFAVRVGIDRSALSQLLSAHDARLPRAETLVAIAGAATVSLDWLLGLSEDDTLATEVARELEIEESAGGADDSRLLEWRREAQGAKIRYAPAHLPDLLRLPEITEAEHPGEGATRRSARLATDRETLALSRTPQADMEVCMPKQRLEALAEGQGVYRDAPKTVRRRQLDRMASLLEDLYPSFRLFLYDGAKFYSAPYTVFGATRVAIYVGDMYLVMNARAHIQALSRHFDRLIRASEISDRDSAAFTRGLLRSL